MGEPEPPDPGSPRGRTLPAWFDDAKFGIFIHWGVAAVPAFAGQTPWIRYEDPEFYRQSPYTEFYQFTMAIPGSPAARYHAERFGDAPYDAFVPRYKEISARWDPEAWADLFERAGARYVVLTTKNEDGFLLWPSDHPNPHRSGWQMDRDVVGELASAVRRRGMRFGTYYCGLDWTFGMSIPDLPPGVGHPGTGAEPLRSAEYAPYMEAHWRELIERYEPSIAWNDYGFPAGADPGPILRLYRERVPDGVVNDRFTDFGDDDAVVPSDFATLERVPADRLAETLDRWIPSERKWENSRGVGAAYGYNHQETDADYASAPDLIHELIETVAHGGNLLLNVGPTGAGELPWLQAQRFLAIGWWLRRYGSALYGTRRWERAAGSTGDGMGVRYTASEDAVHAIVLGTPAEARVELDLRLRDGVEVVLEDQPGTLPWRPTDHGVRIDLPEPPDEQPAIALRLSPRAAVRPA